jgi:hypothetical protein
MLLPLSGNFNRVAARDLDQRAEGPVTGASAHP